MCCIFKCSHIRVLTLLKIEKTRRKVGCRPKCLVDGCLVLWMVLSAYGCEIGVQSSSTHDLSGEILSDYNNCKTLC